MRHAVASTLALAVLASAAMPSAVMTIRGGARTVCSLGDVDGDGCADVVLAEPSSMNGGQTCGYVHVFSGRMGRELYELHGERSLQYFGTSVCSVPDCDGDCVRDLAIGAPGPPLVQGEGRDASYVLGSVTIVSGVDGRMLYRIEGRDGGDRFGADVRLAGDLDRDGVLDWIVGAPGARGRRGRALVYSSRTRALLLDIEGENVGEYLGAAVSAAGDVNGDGIDDVLVGGPGWMRSCARVFSGQDGCEILGLPRSSELGGAGCCFGSSVACAGDIDDDGCADVVIGAEGHDSSGWVFVFSGRTGDSIGGTSGTRTWPWGSFGSALDVVPDVDGDGALDWLVGDPAEYVDGESRGQSTGSFFVISGRTQQVLFHVVGDRSFQRLGFAVAGAGDVDGDGIDDFLVSDDPILGGGPFGPTLYVYSGADGRLLRRIKP